MTLRPCLFAAALLSLTATTTPALAASVTGTAIPDSNGDVAVDGPAPSGPGTYRVTFRVSRPGSGFFEVIGQQTYNFYDIATGEYQGGNDVPYSRFESYVDAKGDTLPYDIPGPYTAFLGDMREEGFYFGINSHLEFNFASPDPVTYRIGFAQTGVPEAPLWLAMIAGFACTAGALRRHRSGSVRALAAQAADL